MSYDPEGGIGASGVFVAVLFGSFIFIALFFIKPEIVQPLIEAFANAVTWLTEKLVEVLFWALR